MTISNDGRLLLVLAGSLAFSTHGAGAPNMQVGEWETGWR